MGGANADNLQSASADQRILQLEVEGRSVSTMDDLENTPVFHSTEKSAFFRSCLIKNFIE